MSPLMAGADLRASAEGGAADAPVVVVGKQNGALFVEAVNDCAQVAGLYPGLTLSEARAQVPTIRVENASPGDDARILRRLARAMERYTPFVGLDEPDGLILDISGCAHLFGGEAAMLADAQNRLTQWGFTVKAAIADNPALAFALARFGEECVRVVNPVLPAGSGISPLNALPVEALRLGDEVSAVLRRLGLKTVEAVLGQPRTPLVRRFGPELARRLDRLSGAESEPISPLSPVEPFLTERRFAEPLMSLDGVAQCTKDLAARLSEALTRRGEGGLRLTLRLFHSDGAVREAGVGASEPIADPARMAALLAPRVEALSARIESDTGIDMMRLSAGETAPLKPDQRDLCGPAHALSDLAALIDTLSERLGAEAVQRFLPADTHLPRQADWRVPAQNAYREPRQKPGGQEGAGAWPTPYTKHPIWQENDEWPVPKRPVRLLAPPEPVEALASIPDGPPVRFRWRRAFYHVAAAEGPERIAPDWWTGEGARTYDYFAVEDTEGRRFWLYREGLYGREAGEPGWFIHGLFA